uniref:Peptidase metallopeptidase domain-containing protein n=1 Tax=Romanomermis culicivorax TaxID=13658 RepID=A0A915L2D8_ROMCU
MNFAVRRVVRHLLFVYLQCILQISSRPLIDKEMLDFLHGYLRRFGYTDHSTELNAAQFHSSMRRLAEDLNETYDSSPASMSKLFKMSSLARCSRSSTSIDHVDTSSNKIRRRRKRFTPHISKWKISNIKWRMRDPFSLFNNINDYEVVRGTLRHSLNLWSEASEHLLNFTDFSANFEDLVNVDTMQHADPAIDMDMFFAVGDHGDHEAFDGKGGIVAHSGYPMVGKIHFDADELWTIDSEQGIDLRYVTLHETGHALGLRHSKNKDAIMYPIYKKGNSRSTIHLSEDDALGIKYLYKNGDVRGYEYMLDSAKQDDGLTSKKIDFED